jgi:hypothetical protein
MVGTSFSIEDCRDVGKNISLTSHRLEVPKWLERRFERITLENERSLTREITYFVREGLEGSPHFVASSRDTYLIPLLRLSRFSTIDVRIAVEGGGEVEHTTMPNERALISAGLQSRWIERHGVDVSREGIVACISVQRTIVPLLSKLDQVPLIRLFKKIQYLDPGTQKVQDQLEIVKQSSDFRAIAHDKQSEVLREIRRDLVRWRDQYLVLAEIPCEAFKPASFLILHTSYRQSTAASFAARRALRRGIVVLMRLLIGPPGFSLSLPVNGVGNSHSSHVLVKAPEGFRAVDGAVEIRFRTVNGSASKLKVFRDFDRLPNEAHVVVDTDAKALHSADVVARFYPYKTGFLIESVICSWLLFSVLDVFYSRVSNRSFQWRHFGFDSPLTASLLLMVPAVIITLVTQRDGNRFASRCFALSKALLAASGAATFAASDMRVVSRFSA